MNGDDEALLGHNLAVLAMTLPTRFARLTHERGGGSLPVLLEALGRELVDEMADDLDALGLTRSVGYLTGTAATYSQPR